MKKQEVKGLLRLVGKITILINILMGKKFFFLIGVLSMQGRTTTTRHRVMRRRITKRLKHTGMLFTKNLQLTDVCFF